MTNTMTHDELVARAIRWLKRPVSTKRPDGTHWYKGGCGVVVPELVSYATETPDAIGWVAGGYSYLVECKTSISDFHADKRKPRHRTGTPGAGAECFYLCPAGLIPKDKVPEGWGLLYCHPKKITIEVVPATNLNRDVTGEITMMYSLLRRVEVRGLLTRCLSKKWGGDDPPEPGTPPPAETSAEVLELTRRLKAAETRCAQWADIAGSHGEGMDALRRALDAEREARIAAEQELARFQKETTVDE